MDTIILKSYEELVDKFDNVLKFGNHDKTEGHFLEIKDNINIIIDFFFSIPFPKEIQEKMIHKYSLSEINSIKLIFKNCSFKYDVIIDNNDKSIQFENCTFIDCLKLNNFSSNLYFIKSSFGMVEFEGVIIEGKVRFRECDFYEVNFNNAKFKQLADFWRCTFNEKTIFYKTDFLGIVVFSGAIFKKNVLFTYSLIDKLIIFNGTQVKKGIDLSTAIITGELSIFNFKLKNFKVDVEKLEKDEYESKISEEGIIPIKNKRETYRLLKKYFENHSNNIESIPFKKLEMTTLHKEAELNFINDEKRWSSFLDLTVLFLNRVSNNFGSSYFNGIIFIFIIGWFFFYLSILQTELYHFSCCISWENIKSGVKPFVQFLNPAHSIDYLGTENDIGYKWSFYIFDYLGRTFVGYGIYQTVQAFRKFR